MPPDKKETGPRANEDRPTRSVPISTITTSIVSPRGIGVTALVFAPSGRRTRWLSIVQDCPHYGHAHAHCGSTLEAPAGVIAAGCRQGHYRLAPQTGVMS